MTGQSVVVTAAGGWYTGAVPGLKPLKQHATYEDLCAVPDHMVAEILNGDLYASPRPAVPHAHCTTRLAYKIGPAYELGTGSPDRPGGWLLLFEPELHLGSQVLVPDLAGWRRTRLPAAPKSPYLTLVPDWLCEVVSPSTARLDRVTKLDIYARVGVPCLWLLDPLERMLEVFRLEQDRWVRTTAHGDDEVVRAEPFDAIELDLLTLWGEERQAAEAAAVEVSREVAEPQISPTKAPSR